MCTNKAKQKKKQTKQIIPTYDLTWMPTHACGEGRFVFDNFKICKVYKILSKPIKIFVENVSKKLEEREIARW